MEAPHGWGRLVRGLRARGATSAIILLVSVVAVAAAATGPAFYAAADAAILADTLHDASAVGQGVEASWQGEVFGLDDRAAVADEARETSAAPDLFSTRIRGQERSWATPAGQESLLAWRDGLCDHVRVSPGRCPTAANEVLISRATAQLEGLRVGGTMSARFEGAAPLRIVGVYEPVAPGEAYWFTRGYFPQAGAQRAVEDVVDAVLTVPQTFAALPRAATGVTFVDFLVDLDAVTADRVAALRTTVRQMRAAVARTGGTVVTSVDHTLDDAEASAGVLQVPVALITVQLLVPVWLLLFLAIGDAAEARAPDLALSSLRGHGRLRTLVFGLGEPLALLVAAFPVGILAGWGATVLLARGALRPGTPVVLPALAVAAAAGALSAGLLAAGLAGWRAVRRPVLEQWRRTHGARTRRGWVVDVAVLVATTAGVVELLASGTVGRASTHVLALLVPGLVGLGVAVLTSRVLPWACRRAFRATGRRGSLGPFLAVRQVARRPAGLRTVLMLATSFALATFAVASWTVTAANTAAVASTRLGASTVLDVVPARGEDLGATVARLDPRGDQAMAVDVFSDFTNEDRRTIAVDVPRFARVAAWRGDFGPEPAATLLARLHPPAPEPVAVTGDRIRLSVTGVEGDHQLALRAGLQLPTGQAVTPVELGTVRAPAAGSAAGSAGAQTLEVALPACPCVLRTLVLTVLGPDGRFTQLDPTLGALTITALQTRVDGSWRAIPAPLTAGGLWRTAGGPADATTGTATPRPDGLRLTYTTVGGQLGPQVTWTANSFPTPLPALISTEVDALPRTPDVTVLGLDGATLAVTPVAVVTVPGAPSGGIIVDRTYARRAAYNTGYTATHQVWLAPGTPDSFTTALTATGVRLIGTRTAAQAEAELRRQGPALASVLFVADAGVAALLASVGAVAGLHLAGRRRRYELSALAASGCRRGTLRAALWLEQLLVLGSGLTAGVVAGVVAVRLALPAVPEFVEAPAHPALLYTPQWEVVAALLGGVTLALVAVSMASGAALMAAVRPDQLREAAA